MKISSAEIESLLFEEQLANVGAPPPGFWRVFFKGGGLYIVNSANTVLGPFATTTALAAEVASLALTHATDMAAINNALNDAIEELEGDISAGVDIELVVAGVVASGDVHVVGGTDVPVADGGTGASTAPGALTNLGITAFIQTLLDDADAAAARATLGAGAAVVTARTLTASGALVLADAGNAVEAEHATVPVVVTVPTNATVPFPVGTVIEVVRTGAAAASLVGAGGVTLNSPGGHLDLDKQWSAATLRKRAADTWLVNGDLS
jgi:hypothetical protein